MFKILDVAEILRRLERAPLLLLETEPARGGLLRDARVRGRKLVRAATIDDSSVLLDAAERDLGIAYVSRVLADSALRSGKVVTRPAVPSTSRPRLWLTRTRLNPPTAVADFVFNWLREVT